MQPLDQALVRYYYKEPDIDYKSWIIKQCSFMPFVLSVVIPVILCVVIKIFKMEFEFSDTIIPLIIGIIGHILFRFSILGVRLEEKSKSYAKISIINKALYAGVWLYVSLCTNKDLFKILQLQCNCDTIASAFALFELKNIWLLNKKIIMTYGYQLAKYGVPFIRYGAYDSV
jgi:hypothetical protein